MSEQEKFLSSLKQIRDYWLSVPNKSTKEVVDGVLFSLLVMFDGDSSANDFHVVKITDICTNKSVVGGELHDMYCRSFSGN